MKLTVTNEDDQRDHLKEEVGEMTVDPQVVEGDSIPTTLMIRTSLLWTDLDNRMGDTRCPPPDMPGYVHLVFKLCKNTTAA